jgi:hypothetical protein
MNIKSGKEIYLKIMPRPRKDSTLESPETLNVVSLVTTRTRPRKKIIVASVATKAGIENQVIRTPLNRPITKPAASGTQIARATEYFERRMNRKPLKEKTELTLRSIEPQRMTKVIPMATKPIMLAVRAKFAKFSNVRKNGLIRVPITNTTTSPMSGLLREANSLTVSNADVAFMLLLRYRCHK